MTVPLWGRYLVAVIGLALVIIDGISVVGTLIVPRPAGGRLMVWVDRLVHMTFELLTADGRLPAARPDPGRRSGHAADLPAARLAGCRPTWGSRCCCGRSCPAGSPLSFDTAGPALWFIGERHRARWRRAA